MNKYSKGWRFYRLKDNWFINIWLTGGIIYQPK